MSIVAMRSSACRSPKAHKSQPKSHSKAILLEALEQRALLSAATDVFQPINVIDTTPPIHNFVIPPTYTAITAGPDGNMWFIESHANTIGRVTPDGTITQFDLPPASSPATPRYLGSNLTTGADGKLWFTVHTATDPVYQILTLTPDGQFAEVSPVQQVPIGELTTGPDGNIWYTQTNGKIGCITPQGQITQFAVDQMQAFTHIAPGPDGNIWFVGHGAESTSGTLLVSCWGSSGLNLVGNITPQGDIRTFPTADPSYYRIDDLTTGPDGNLYFARPGGLARITPTGTITSLPMPDLAPGDLTPGPDGALWFIDQRSVLNPLVRMDLDQSLTQRHRGVG